MSEVFEVFIGRCHNVQEAVLQAAFMPYGAVDVRVRPDKGCAFATFTDHAAAERAISGLNGLKLDHGPGEGINVKFANAIHERRALGSDGEPKIIIHNLNVLATQEAITALCQQFGEVMETQILKKTAGQAPRAFVTFTHMQSAEGAISILNGFQHDLAAQGKSLQVELVVPEVKKEEPPPLQAPLQAHLQLFQEELAPQTSQMALDLYVASGQPVDPATQVDAASLGLVQQAMDQMLQAAAKGQMPVQANGEQSPQIFMGGLPLDATDDYVYGMMAPFGVVTEAWVHKKRNAEANIGFARFVHTASAQMAVAVISQAGKFNIKFSELDGGMENGNKRSWETAFAGTELASLGLMANLANIGGLSLFAAEAPMIPRLGDWVCPSCSSLQVARQAVCKKCGTIKPILVDPETMGVSLVIPAPSGPKITHPAKPGDWVCPKCNDLQFARNMVCRKCQGPKPPQGEEGIDRISPTGAVAPIGYADRTGDWICTSCSEVQYAKNTRCDKCAAERPPAPTSELALPTQSGYSPKPGDWLCPLCCDVQFAKNIQCRKCGAPNPILAQIGSAAVPALMDWICPNCNDVQFARNQSCRKCGAINPSMPQPGTQLQIPPQLQYFVDQWGLDQGSVVTLLQLDSQSLAKVLVEFAPKSHTQDVNKLFRGFVRSIMTPGSRRPDRPDRH